MLSKNQIKSVTALHLKKFRQEENLFIAVSLVYEVAKKRPLSQMKCMNGVIYFEFWIKVIHQVADFHNLLEFRSLFKQKSAASLMESIWSMIFIASNEIVTRNFNKFTGHNSIICLYEKILNLTCYCISFL